MKRILRELMLMEFDGAGILINPLNLSGYYRYSFLKHLKSLHFVHRVCVYVSYHSDSKQQLFHYSALTGWPLQYRYVVFSVR
jgi:hypothetical protein